MRALAAPLNMPEDMLPLCRREGRGGWSIDLSEDGTEYVYSATEKGIPYDLFRSPDKELVLEAVFVDLTERMAGRQVADRYPPMTYWRSLLGPLLPRPGPLKQQREVQIVQEELLGRVNPVWRDRCAIANALRLRRDLDFWLGLQA